MDMRNLLSSSPKNMSRIFKLRLSRVSRSSPLKAWEAIYWPPWERRILRTRKIPQAISLKKHKRAVRPDSDLFQGRVRIRRSLALLPSSRRMEGACEALPLITSHRCHLQNQEGRRTRGLIIRITVPVLRLLIWKRRTNFLLSSRSQAQLLKWRERRRGNWCWRRPIQERRSRLSLPPQMTESGLQLAQGIVDTGKQALFRRWAEIMKMSFLLENSEKCRLQLQPPSSLLITTWGLSSNIWGSWSAPSIFISQLWVRQEVSFLGWATLFSKQ